MTKIIAWLSVAAICWAMSWCNLRKEESRHKMELEKIRIKYENLTKLGVNE